MESRLVRSRTVGGHSHGLESLDGAFDYEQEKLALFYRKASDASLSKLLRHQTVFFPADPIFSGHQTHSELLKIRMKSGTETRSDGL